MNLLLLLACGGSGDPVAGADVYAATCATCHGADGKLGVQTAGIPAPDLTVEVPGLSDAELTDISQNGVGVMPGQGTDDTETADLIAYLRETFP